MVALSRSPFGGSVAVRVFCMRRGRGLHSEAGVTSAPRFRPCLCRFFVKGTVGCAICPAVLTVPLPLFYKRHGRVCRLPHGFDRAFDTFL